MLLVQQAWSQGDGVLPCKRVFTTSSGCSASTDVSPATHPETACTLCRVTVLSKKFVQRQGSLQSSTDLSWLVTFKTLHQGAQWLVVRHTARSKSADVDVCVVLLCKLIHVQLC